METNEVSLHQLKVYEAVKAHGKWITIKEIAATIDGVAHRTVTRHAKKLVELGVFDIAEVSPAHRYRLSKFAEKRNKSYIQRLDAAREVFGLE